MDHTEGEDEPEPNTAAATATPPAHCDPTRPRPAPRRRTPRGPAPAAEHPRLVIDSSVASWRCAFAPGQVHVGAIRLSWVAPTGLTDVTLDDPSGKRVVTAPAGRVTSSLWDFIVHPSRPVTLELDRAAFVVERHSDGSIDLAEALSGIFAGRDPTLDLAIRADGATAEFRARPSLSPSSPRRWTSSCRSGRAGLARLVA